MTSAGAGSCRGAEQTWEAVDRFITDRLVEEDEALRAARLVAGLPTGAITPNVGKLLELLVRVRAPGGSLSSARSAAIARSGSPAAYHRRGDS